MSGCRGKCRMEETIRKYFQCWLDKDVDTVNEIFNDDVIYPTSTLCKIAFDKLKKSM